MRLYAGLATFQHPAHSEKVLELVSPSRLAEPASHLSELEQAMIKRLTGTDYAVNI